MSRTFSLAPLLAALLALSLAACTASEAAAPPPSSSGKAQPQATGDAKAICVQLFTRNRTCTAQYIPALVDLRAKYDVPAGIAAEVAANRAEVIAHANEEWVVDGTDAAIDATCTQVTANVPPEVVAASQGVLDCLPIEDCTAYTTCVMPFFEQRFKN
jgi:hypothetical protein